MAQRPYKLFGAHERAAAAAAIEARVAAWAAEWLPEAAAPRVEAAPASELEPRLAAAEGWSRHAAQNGESVALLVPEKDLQELAALLCGCAEARRSLAGEAASEIVGELAQAALRELASGLLDARAVSISRAGPDDAWLPHCAAYAAEITLGAARVGVVSSAAWTLRLLREKLPRPQPARLTDRRSAVAAQTVRLHAVAGWAELDCGVVQALAVGNVIALEARIDRPMSLATMSGTTLCGARLGSLEGRRALSLGVHP
jgi:hypothetical protein